MASGSSTTKDFDHVSNKVLDLQKDCNDVIIALKDVQGEWRELGTQLNVLPGTLSRILRIPAPDGNHFKHLCELISAWIRRERREDHPSWRQLCIALEAMGKFDLADKIAQEHGKKLAVDEIDGANSSAKHENVRHKKVSGRQRYDLVCTDETCDDDSIPSQTTSPVQSHEKGYVKRNVPKGDGREYLAVTISNTYRNTDMPLEGVEHDYIQLCKTFDSFDHIKGKNISCKELNEVLDETEDAVRKAKQPYKLAFFVFSGHGGISRRRGTPFILTEDRKANRDLPRVDLNKLIDTFLEIIGNKVPTFFIIDACRSVPRDATKGDGEHNYLVGYATKEGDKASCNPDTGSYWIQAVAKGLRCVHNPEPVVKVLKRARQQVIDQTGSQKPHIDDKKLKDKGVIFVYQPEDSDEEADDEIDGSLNSGGGARKPPYVPIKGDDDVVGPFHFKNHYCWRIAIVTAVIFGLIGVVIGLRMVSGDSKIAMPTEKELLNTLQGLTTNLESLCVHLDLTTCSEIFDDKTATFDHQRLQLIKRWGKRKPRTWSDLVKALDGIGECTLAIELADRYSLKHKLETCL